MTNNQTKCGIIYENTLICMGDDEQMITYEWLKKDLSIFLIDTCKVYITILELFLL